MLTRRVDTIGMHFRRLYGEATSRSCSCCSTKVLSCKNRPEGFLGTKNLYHAITLDTLLFKIKRPVKLSAVLILMLGVLIDMGYIVGPLDLIYSFIHLFIYSFIHLFIYSFINLFIYSFIHLFIYSFIHLFIYSFIQSYLVSAALTAAMPG